jgi:hypothetical protein
MTLMDMFYVLKNSYFVRFVDCSCLNDIKPISLRYEPENLRYRIVDKIVKKCYRKDLASTKRFVSMLLRNYVAQFKSLPDVEVKK